MCYHGAFMERFIGSNLIEHGLLPQSMGAWPNRLPLNIDICKSYGSGELARACWREIVHPAVLYHKMDPMAVFDTCKQAPNPEFVGNCKHHSLPEFAGALKYNFDALRKICELPENSNEFRGSCYRTLVSLKMQFTSLEAAKDSVDFCGSIDDEFQKNCFSNIAYNLRNKLNGAERKAYCQNAPKKYQQICIGPQMARGIIPRILQWVRRGT
jgi:hypothetical protein